MTELEKRILDNPDDLDAWDVYADALQQAGDPRGELIAIQVELFRHPPAEPTEEEPEPVPSTFFRRLVSFFRAPAGPSRPLNAQEERAQALIRDNASDWYGGLPTRRMAWSEQSTFTWRFGFIDVARINYDFYGLGPEYENYPDADEGGLELILRRLLDHPSAKFLRTLHLGINRGDPECLYQQVIDVLAAQPNPSIRELYLGDFEYPDEIEMSWTEVGRIDPFFDKALFPRLERLIVQGGEILLDAPPSHPTLRRLEVRTGGLPQQTAAHLAKARFPQLRHYEVWYGDDGYGGEATIEDLAPLWSGEGLPVLEHLALCNAGFTNAIAERCVQAPLLKRVTTLDLSMGTLTEDGANHLRALDHLEAIDVSENFLDEAGTWPEHWQIGEQRFWDDEDTEGNPYLYVAVGE